MEVYADWTQHDGNRSTILATALDAALHEGVPVFPLRGKHPALRKCQEAKKLGLTGRELAEHAAQCGGYGHGVYDASTQPQQIIAMFNAVAGRYTGYGVATGRRSGRVVADIDSEQGVEEAQRRGLTSERVVRSGRYGGGGWHVHLAVPEGGEGDIPSRDIAPGIRLQGDGCYVAGPGSLHPSGRSYRLAKDGDPAPAPAWLLERPVRSSGSSRTIGGPITVDVAGPPIVEGAPGRNRTLTRICGKLHDGTRDLEQLERDLLAVNEARCQPPLDTSEVQKIARSIHGRPPCKPHPQVSEVVTQRIAYLRDAAEGRQIRGRGGGSGWSIYHAILRAGEKWGREHPRGVAIQVDVRTLAAMAAKDKSTVSRFLKRSRMVRVPRKGSGRHPMTLLVVPKTGGATQHSSTSGVPHTQQGSRSVAVDPLFVTLTRSRWPKRRIKRRRGVVPKSAKVYDHPPQPPREALERMGPSKAALLWKIRTRPNARRAEISGMLGIKPDSLKKPLKWLLEAGFIVRTGRGRYTVADDLQRRAEDARVLGEEDKDDRLQTAQHARERDGYRRYLEEKRSKDQEPPSEEEGVSEASRENIRRSREHREQHLREQRERAEQESRQEKPSEEDLEKRRVEELIRQGMSRRFAEGEVYDPGGSPFHL